MALIAFDVDETLIDHRDEPRCEYVAMLRELARYNDVIVWSGGGADYAYMWVRRLKLDDIVSEDRCFHKFDWRDKPPVDVAFDDMYVGHHMARAWVPVR